MRSVAILLCSAPRSRQLLVLREPALIPTAGGFQDERSRGSSCLLGSGHGARDVCLSQAGYSDRGHGNLL